MSIEKYCPKKRFDDKSIEPFVQSSLPVSCILGSKYLKYYKSLIT